MTATSSFITPYFDITFLKRDGISVPQHLVHDTMVASHLENNLLPAGLKPSAARHVDKRVWAGKNALSAAMSAHNWTWDTVPVDLPAYWIYSVMDTIFTARLMENLWPKIQEFREVYELEL